MISRVQREKVSKIIPEKTRFYCQYCGWNTARTWLGECCINPDCPIKKALDRDFKEAGEYPADDYHRSQVKKLYDRKTGEKLEEIK